MTELPSQAAYRIIKDMPHLSAAQYIKNWFSAGPFFNSFFQSNVADGHYFITGDKLMHHEQWAVRDITPQGIVTLAGPLDTQAEAEAFLQKEMTGG